VDLVLSSGFLAFARHIGFLEAVEARQIEVDAVIGTSSGAMVGALWTAGVSLDEIARELSARAPIKSLGLHAQPWRGVFSMRPVIERLRAMLPERIEELPRPFAVGVVDRMNRYRLLTRGPIVEAVAASCAMPRVFAPVEVDGQPFADGGAADRLGIEAWRNWRPHQTAIVHHVQRSAGREVEVDLRGLTVVRTPRSGASFWSLGPFEAQREEARELTHSALR
jgi:predicted acylesterase/phospholipase RssA